MRLSKSDLGEVALNFLETLDRGKILALQDLKTRIGTEIRIGSDGRERIIFGTGASKQSTSALFMDYCSGDGGISVEFRFNIELGYSQSIVKCTTEIEGYAPFVIDPFDNIVQMKFLEFSEDDLGRGELRRLSSLK